MEITYIGHSSFRIKFKGGILVTDPYDPSMMGVKFPKVSADIVTVSHEHPDHNKVDQVRDVRKVVSGPGEYDIGGVSIIGIPSYHDDKKGDQRGKNTIYIYEIEEYRLVHLGDLGHNLDESDIETLGDVDILMLPVGGFYTIDSKTAIEITRLIEPTIVIPMHYKHSALNQETFGNLEELSAFLSNVGLTVEESDKLILKGPLSEEKKVVNLKPLYDSRVNNG